MPANKSATPEQATKAKEDISQALLGLLRGLTTDTAGAPIDLIAGAMQALGIPVGDKPVGGSEWMRALLDQPSQAQESPAATVGNLLSALIDPAKAGASGAIMIGAKAKTWNKEAADLAKKLNSMDGPEAAAARRKLFQDEGYFISPGDRQARKEIRDTNASMASSSILRDLVKYSGNTEFKLSDLLDHPELYANYPELKDLPIELFDNPASLHNGSFNPIWGITLNTEGENPLSTLLHEIQHAIQSNEGFARGGSPARMDPKSAAGIQATQELRKKGFDLTDDQIKEILYRRLAGEAEARAVQKRFEDARLPTQEQLKFLQSAGLAAPAVHHSMDLYGISPADVGGGYDILFKNLISRYE